MANEEEVALGPRKTMFVLVIVVACFAMLWPRILSPLILGNARDQLKPNKYDREAGCCEVLFDTEVVVLELVNEVCSSAFGLDGKLSPYAAAECRKTVNSTCGLDIAAFLKRNENVGKTTKMLLDLMKTSNSSCLKEHFGVPTWNLNTHITVPWTQQSDKLKQERPPNRGASPHPALLERGRAIPAGAPASPSRGHIVMPPHVRVRTSPLSVYYDLDIKPPPIPGMRPPLGSAAGGPMPTPKSSMGFFMPVYTICILLFFVYTLSKILFKRGAASAQYQSVDPDPYFRRRVFRDDSRSSPDTKLGDEELELLRARLAETERAMQRIVGQLAKRNAADVQDDSARPYTNGTVLTSNNAPVRIIASEYKDPPKEVPEKILEDHTPKEVSPEPTPEPKETTPEPKDSSPEPKESTPKPKEPTPEPKELTPEPKEPTPEPKEPTPEPKEPTPELKEQTPELKDLTPEPEAPTTQLTESTPELKESTQFNETDETKLDELLKFSTGNGDVKRPDSLIDASKDFISAEAKEDLKIVSTLDLEQNKKEDEKKQSTPELLAEALKEDSPGKEELSEEEIEEEVEEEEEEDVEPEKSSVKVLGMEMTAHAADGGAWPAAEPPLPAPRAPTRPMREAEDVKSIYLETDIPQQSRVLVAEFEDHTDPPVATKHSPLVVSGKMTLSLIQDAPRDTPERDLESTVDDFTTASAVTQHDEKKEDLSEEELEEEEIEIEEIEEVEEEEEVEVEEDEEEIEAQKK